MRVKGKKNNKLIFILNILEKTVRISFKLNKLQSIKHQYDMIKYSVFFAGFLWSILGVAQLKEKGLTNLQQYIDSNLTEVKGGEYNENDTYEDLVAIRDAIGTAKVVMLGEQDHGDAPTFIVKTRLIKYLHEQLGFEIIAFESDFYGLNRSWEKLENQQLTINEVYKNIFPIWSKCQQVQPLFSYIKQQYNTNKKLIVTGFDCQDHQYYSTHYLVKELKTYLQEKEIPFIKTKEYEKFISTIEKMISTNPTPFVKLHQKQKTVFLNQLEIIEKQLYNTSTSDSFWIQTIRSIEGEAKDLWVKNENSVTSDNIRDTQMAKNLLWLVKKKYPNKKIIVWLHSGHAAKNMNVVTKTKKEIISVGKLMNKELKNDLYVLGFTSYSGSTGRLTMKNQNIYTIKPPSVESIEHFIYKKGFQYAFLNFKPVQNQLGQFEMKGVSHYEIKAMWTNVFDGIFYVRDMYPCDRVN